MRLIDADALFSALNDMGWYDYADKKIALDLVEDAPTVSTPYLIHCQDCEYWDADNAQDFSSTNMGMAPCRLKSDTYSTSPFDFCSNAKERMPWYD